jgi:phosphoserine phosphatase
MDSTLIDMEIINELAKVAGVGEKVEDITTKAMQGKIDFERALKDRVRLLRGLPEREVKRVAETAPLIRGAKRLIKEAKSRGYKTALVTGSFMTVAKIIGEKLNLDYVIANELGVKDGRLIGDVKGPLLTLDSKEQVLVQIAALEGVPLKNCVVVGDGANDMGMFKRAGLSIAFNANSVLKDVADITITQKNLELIIPLLP